MTEDLTGKIRETKVFRHQGKILLLTEHNDDSTKTYTVRDGAGRTLCFGEKLPLEFYHEDTILAFEMGPGRDLSPEGKIIDVQKPTLYRRSATGQPEDLV